jgi:hypothetical protein
MGIIKFAIANYGHLKRELYLNSMHSSMFIKTVLEWSYAPTDAFEAPYTFTSQDFELYINNGVASITFNQARQQLNETERLTFENIVRIAIRGIQAVTHKYIELSGSILHQYDSGGKQHTFIGCKAAIASSSATIEDIIIHDQDGNITYDSRAEQIQKNHEFVTNVLSHAPQDGLLCLLLNSYSASINDPSNEFLYLFEIRDALSTHFGSKKKTKEALGISENLWNRLGNLANHEPLEQSRHRGLHTSGMRCATLEESAEARQIARQMIESYVAYMS